MAVSEAKDLGELIIKANPYADEMEIMSKQTEQDYTVLMWQFKNGSYRVAKALRIPYCYRDDEGVEIQDYLLIGYEGAGGA